LLANGAAAGKESKAIDVGSEGYEEFKEVVTGFSEELAKLVVRDGEGATKFVTVRVVDAMSFEDAVRAFIGMQVAVVRAYKTSQKQVASTIARSPLVKTALYGRKTLLPHFCPPWILNII